MKKIYVVSIAVILVLIFAFIWWNQKKVFLKNVDPSKVYSITVRNGNTGNIFEITDQKDILYIVENIQKNSFSKERISVFYTGTFYTLTLLDSSDRVIDKFIINWSDTIRKDPFFYSVNDGDLQNVIDYLKNLENA